MRVISDALSSESANIAAWQLERDSDPASMWIHVCNNRGRTLQQGWKLHVSASAASAETVLQRAVPVLLAEDATFKIVASIFALSNLNEAHDGALSQIGKFITVYPNDDAQAVRLAVALDEATRGLDGPAIPSDRPLAPGSLVYYRYGGFDGRCIQTPLGEILPAIRTPDGDLVPDQRLSVYKAPKWAVDPFVAAGVAVEFTPPSTLIGERYLIVSTLHESPRGEVYLAVDIDSPQRCVLKRARHDRLSLTSRGDVRDRLRYEADVLARLAPDSRFPAAYELIEQDGDLFLAMEDVMGETLEARVWGLLGQGRLPSGRQVVAWGRELAGMLEKIHAKGFIYRDLKSSNVIVTHDRRLRLLDFDISYELGAQDCPHGQGTRGYMSPQQQTGAPPAVTDDIYSLGALLYFAATGAEPSQAPHPFALLNRPLTLLNPAIGTALEKAISRCLESNPARRFPSMEVLDAALAAISAEASVTPAPFGAELAPEPEEQVRRHSRELACQIGTTLCAVAQRTLGLQGLAWVSTHSVGSGIRSRDLNIGNAGTVLALAELVAEVDDDPKHSAVLAEGALWLAEAPRLEGTALPGLYVGEAGVGAALLRAGQVLSSGHLIASAAERGQWIATLPCVSPDLFNGTAGRLRFHLMLWDETKEQAHLQDALAAGEFLLGAVEDAGDDGSVRWTIPSGYAGLSGQANLGYAHGAAGIADALLDLFEATSDERFLAAAQGAGLWLARSAIPALEDGSGLNWPVNEGETPSAAFWCHGAAGIGRFFLHASQLGVLPRATEISARAARTVAHATRWANPTQCHGLAGNIEFLLDMFQATGKHVYLTEARSLARLLEAFAVKQDGLLLWPSESPMVVTPDFMVGYAGVAMCLLRLGDPEHLPHLLSRQGFLRHNGQRREGGDAGHGSRRKLAAR